MQPDDFARTAGLARRRGAPLPPEALRLAVPRAADGYALQQKLSEWFAAEGLGPTVGYKIGATTAGMQAYLGVTEPLGGRLRAADRVAPGGIFRVPGDCPLGLECELAFVMAEDVPGTGGPWTRDAIRPYIASCHAALELVENRYGDFRACAVGVIVGDDVFQRGFVMDEPADWRGLDLARVAGRVTVDGVCVATGRGAEVMGDPVEAVAWLANAAPRIGCPLRRGDIVLTGSMSPVHWLEGTPADVGVEIEGIGTLRVTVDRAEPAAA